MTIYTPRFDSPIAVDAYANQTSKTENLRLADLTGAPVVLIQGDAGEVLAEQFPDLPEQPGSLVDIPGGVLARLTPHEFYLFGLSVGAELPGTRALNDRLIAAGSAAHATDFSHGRALLKLAGPAADEMLSKICGLDFYDLSFPTRQVKQTSAAKIKTLIVRRDEGSTLVYHLHVNRPFAQYFWDIVWDAGQEFGIEVA